MSRHRFFAESELPPEASGGVVDLPLSAEDAHHALHVLRLQTGDNVQLVTLDRRVLDIALEVERPGGKRASTLRGRVIGATDDRPFEPRVTLVQGLLRGPRMDEVVEKAVEVGAEGVLPVAFARSVSRVGPAKAGAKSERWSKIARAAARQSGRTFVPSVEAPVSPAALLERLGGFDVVLVAWEEAGDAPGIVEALSRERGSADDPRVALVVGPEGGLRAEEVRALVAAGAVAVSLGTTTLRAATAGMLAVALAVYALGGLGGLGGSERGSERGDERG